MIRVGRRADTLDDAATELQAVMTVVEATSQPMSRRDPLRPFMDIIYKYAQDKSPFKPAMVPRVSSPAQRAVALGESAHMADCSPAFVDSLANLLLWQVDALSLLMLRDCWTSV